MQKLYCTILLAALCGCAGETESTGPHHPALQLRPALQYRIDPLPTAGPGTSQGAGINDEGWVAGFTGMPNGTRQAALWRGGAITPLGTLPGGAHSMVQWPGINRSGTIVGISRIGTDDPNGEDWSCSAFLPGSGKVCLGFVWENGVMSPLPTLGGPNGFATGVNAPGQVVGWAENTVFDPTCNAPQKLQFRGVLWNTKQGTKQALPPFPGDPTSAATAINDRGQIVGISGECDVAVGRRSATHAVLWENGTVRDLGNLGGSFWHTPMAINDRGDVVGFGNPPGGDIEGDNLRAFLWTRAGGIQDLGKLDQDDVSEAFSINGRGQIVGVSCGALCAAVLWQDGKLHLLKDLVTPGFTGYLWSARSINDAGRITGRMYDANGTPMGYVATPIAAPSASAPR
jgi:probable HAF family extracellular repeat protein